jgi:hypothetical protein
LKSYEEIKISAKINTLAMIKASVIATMVYYSFLYPA